MSYVTKTDWASRTEYDSGHSLTRMTVKKMAIDSVLKIAGGAVMYSAGRLLGEGIDNVPYLNEWIPQVVKYVSGIEVQNSVDGLGGLAGLIYGVAKSGVSLDDESLEIKKISVAPFYLNR
jgi:hypothetical protein